MVITLFFLQDYTARNGSGIDYEIKIILDVFFIVKLK